MIESVKLPSGRTVLLEPHKAAQVRLRLIQLREKNARIERELRQEHLTPRDSYSPTAKVTGSNYYADRSPVRSNREVWHAEKQTQVNTAWASFNR